MAYEVPLSYTIGVSLSATPQGLADFNTNSIAIFTNDPAGFSESYRAYITPNGVGSDFGTNTLTAKMANALFTPVPNFRTGEGYLYVFPFNGTNATSGSLTTPTIAGNITAFRQIVDGVLNIAIDGVDYELTGLNFSTIKTLQDIVTVLKARNLDCYIEVVDNKIKFTSKKYGTDATIEISAKTVETGTDIYGSNYLNIASAETVNGVNATGETLAEAVEKAQKQVYFGGVLSTQYVEDDLALANAQAIQALDVTAYLDISSLKDIEGLGSQIKGAGLGKTRMLAMSNSPEEAKIALATYATIAKSVNYNGTATCNTMNLKTLTGCIADNGLNDTYVLQAEQNGVDIYGNTGGLYVTYSNDNNGYTDDIEGRLWIKKAMEVAGFNYLRQTNTKIPQTEEGMTGLKDSYGKICQKAINNGFIAPGSWNSAVPFGDPENFKRNIEERGYYIYSMPIAQQSQTEREARKAPVVQIALKCSGAIHHSDVIINIER